MLKSILIFLLFFIYSGTLLSKKLTEGVYRGVLLINSEKRLEIPFNFEVKYKGKKPQIIIKNADERILVDEIIIKGDSVNFKMPFFDTEFKTVMSGDNLEGVWINHYKATNNIIKFSAYFKESKRFVFAPGKPEPIFEGRWETTFSPDTKDSSKAIGIFHHIEQTDYVTGTFLTETGDYRYLEGMKHDSELFLSCFDGVHAYLFTAVLNNNGNLEGTFYSGITWQEKWIAKLNDKFKLADPETITFLTKKDEKIHFSFPNLDKKIISLDDKIYENKPVIIQIMGSWCPNCMDESIFLSALNKQYNGEGLKVIALAFEKTNDFEKASALLQRMKIRLKMDYDILITQQTGSAKASETFSMLNKITAFPTTIFLNKQHQIAKIYTGFSGPATGNDYEVYKQKTETLVKYLLKE